MNHRAPVLPSGIAGAHVHSTGRPGASLVHPLAEEACAQRRDHGRVRLHREHLDHRAAPHERRAERRERHDQADRRVLPAREVPLPVPEPGRVPERPPVVDGPARAAERAIAAAREVAEEVQVEGHRREERDLPPFPRHRRAGRHRHARAREAVGEDVVPVGVRLLSEREREPVEVRRDTGRHHEDAVTPLRQLHAGQPRQLRMHDGVHGSSLAHRTRDVAR